MNITLHPQLCGGGVISHHLRVIHLVEEHCLLTSNSPQYKLLILKINSYCNVNQYDCMRA